MKTNLILIALVLVISGCASIPIATPKVGGTGFEVVPHSGYAVTQARYEAMLKAGAEAKYFYPYHDGSYVWFISSENEPYVADDMTLYRNKTSK